MSPQAKQILKDARERYGKAWDLMSEDQRQNYVQSRVLMLILAQGGEQFDPAQQLAQRVLSEVETI